MKKSSDNRISDSQRASILAEYNALRSEILKRIELRNSIQFGTLSFAGVLLGFGIATPTLALIYVIIATFLAAAWVQSDVVISELGCYIREQLESSQIGLQWETHRQRERLAALRKKKFQPSVVFSTGGIFLVTQAVAILIAFSNIRQFTLLEWILSTIAVIGILVTAYFFQYASRQN
jgi:amino acid transporter